MKKLPRNRKLDSGEVFIGIIVIILILYTIISASIEKSKYDNDDDTPCTSYDAYACND